jgi:SsrA-binding protein
LAKKEIAKLAGASKESGYTLVPISLYFKDGYAKVELGLGKGKKSYDKRESLKQKDAAREMDRARARERE